MLRNVVLKSKPSADYIFTHDNTIRHTKPFFQKYDTRTKGRMLGKSFIESFCAEYVVPEDVFMQYCEHDFIKLNKKRVEDANHIMGYKDSYQTEDVRTDKITTNFDSIEVIYEDDSILVLAKPENVPVHSMCL
ncbi:predicted protein [Naegleria gruberi]|uniref:Predicted protein n=1 Tax=Naegleria gruberi TaxID=5762 RepID=D2VUY2_NAEGR|nr:uncharacterized protein NAEGRDRAFT_72826 [Naegleria gruberi]EFC39345.1 predicted protein [Naegleria gruberi]|eukprot:XP_002672089.1 predicted protein [Naegleria gruberi strain NEG-M]